MAKEIRPSDLKRIDPMNSVFQDYNAEIIVRNIIIILSRTGDVWRTLPWEEYVAERKKDGNFSGEEKGYFDKVISYTTNGNSAISFSPQWKKITEE